MKANKFEFAFYKSLFPLTNSLLRFRHEAIFYLSSFTSRAARPLHCVFVLALHASLELSRKFWIQMRFFTSATDYANLTFLPPRVWFLGVSLLPVGKKTGSRISNSRKNHFICLFSLQPEINHNRRSQF